MDMNEIATLLHIEEKTREQPKLRSIWNEAVRVLEAHAADVTRDTSAATGDEIEEEQPEQPKANEPERRM